MAKSIYMPALLSLVTSVKDYIEIAHKLVETQGANYLLGSNPGSSGLESFLGIRDYNEFGSVLTYVVLSIKEFLIQFLSFGWLNNIWSLPLIVPDVASAMISEISVLDSYFTNAFSFLENGLSTTLQSNANTIGMATDNLVALQKVNQNPFLFGFEKFIIGLLNSFFLFLPTSTAHLITLRRFVMQGVEAGFLAGLGTIAGNFVWLASIILGLRFIVIPWLSLDIFRYVLGFLLLVKYLWDSSKELNKTTKSNLDDNGKIQIVLLNFLLAFTEQTSIYPFISNMSFGPEGSIIEGFSGTIFQSDNAIQFFGIHFCYLFGILLGSFSLLQFTVWFWENPAFSIYMWMVSTYRVTTSSYYKILNFVFLYLTMLCAISSIPYFGLDYTITNPLGFIPQDRMITQKSDPATGGGDPILQETAFLGVKPTDKNTRIKEGVHARRERWKERLIKYQAFDASLYDQGVYDILTVEDLNYGFDRFWLRRKMRNHQIRFRLFPGPWMRSLKKQLNKPGFTGPRMEFFRILFEQYYHPSFHAIATSRIVGKNKNQVSTLSNTPSYGTRFAGSSDQGAYNVGSQSSILANPSVLGSSKATLGQTLSENPALDQRSARQSATFHKQKGLVAEYSALRKFARNVNTRVNTSLANVSTATLLPDSQTKTIIYSKALKSLFTKINQELPKENLKTFRNLSKNLLIEPRGGFLSKNKKDLQLDYTAWDSSNQGKLPVWRNSTDSVKNSNLRGSFKELSIRKKLSKKERLLLLQKAQLNGPTANSNNPNLLSANVAVQPLNYYFQKNEAFKRKLKYYSTITTRKFSVGNNAPYFKSLLKRSFFYYKPSLRLKRTLFTAALRRGFRKKSVMPKKLLYKANSLESNVNLARDSYATQISANVGPNPTLSTSQYSVLGKRASRYRYQIYKDVLSHWYYTPFNRLLLKFDVDSFMNRQPKTQVLTKNEERLLHLRRVLLAEHYNTLRWYTYMQHYRTMKSKIGGVKSFANSVYNQQFQGTFKKIRHLFAITPSQATTSANLSVLKFDQPLYNESNQTSAGGRNSFNNFNKPVESKGLKTSKFNFEIQSPYKHEDLTKGESARVTKTQNSSTTFTSKPSQDFIDTSLGVTGSYILQGQEQTVKNGSGELTRPDSKTDLMKAYIAQKNYVAMTNLLANPDTKSNFDESKNKSAPENLSTTTFESSSVLLDLLKQSKMRLNDQTFLKNYISHRIEKRDQRAKATSKEVASKLASFKNWLSPIASINSELATNLTSAGNTQVKTSFTKGGPKLTTGSRKALSDGIRLLREKATTSGRSSLNPQSMLEDGAFMNQLDTNKQITNTLISLKEVNSTLDQLKTTREFNTNMKSLIRKNISISQSILNTILKPFVVAQNSILAKRSEKNLEWWRQKNRVLTKRKASRKKSRAKNIKQVYQKNQPNANNPNNMSERAFTNWQDNNRELLNSSLNMPSWRDSSNLYSNSSNLRQKQEEQSDNLLSRAHKTFNQYFLLKFRKKASSKGRRYRNMSMSRGFAYVRKPKNVNSFTTIPEYLDNIESIVGSNTITSIRKMYSKDILDKSLLSKEDKLQFLKDFKAKLAKTVLTVERQNQSYASGTQLKNLLMAGAFGAKTQMKKSVNKKRSKRTWKKRKRQKFTKNHYKYRKRQIHGLGKLRVLAKKAKRIQATQEFQHWWWNKYLPTIAEKASKMNNGSAAAQPKSDLTFKPLSTTKALEIRSNLGASLNPSLSKGLDPKNSYSNLNKLEVTSQADDTAFSGPVAQGAETPLSRTILDEVYSRLMDETVKAPSDRNLNLESSQNPFRSQGWGTSFAGSNYNVTTTIPFYAGWDESLRKFVVTNRILSRRDAGFEANINAIFGQRLNGQVQNTNSALRSSGASGSGEPENLTQQFTQAPVKGLNEASYLYLQTDMPFNSYIIDQFVPNNQSFYAPLGWSRFQFRHSLLNTWMNHKAKMTSSSSQNTQSGLLSKTNYSFFINKANNQSFASLGSSNTQNNSSRKAGEFKLENRRIKKRYALLKQSQMNLAYVPTGSLLAETLPSHFIAVFDKSYRMPRTRYIKRNLPKVGTEALNLDSTVKDLTILDYLWSDLGGPRGTVRDKNQEQPSFTLRKRIKPKRKYHKKRFTKKDGLIFPRRRKFGSFELQTENSVTTPNSNPQNLLDSNFRLRPSPRMNVDDLSGTKTSSKALSAKSKKQSASAGRKPTKTNPTRLRQLRRREFQQVFKPLTRFQPRSGGFTWPGDYLRLETIPMPKLENTQHLLDNSTNSVKSTQSKLKRKINVQPIGLLPRKYLLQKHNLKVFKKKLALKYMG